MSVYDIVRSRDGNRCRVCASTELVQVHHIVFRSQGGLDTEGNLVALCGTCHGRAHNTEPDYIAPWELQLLVNDLLIGLRFIRHDLRHKDMYLREKNYRPLRTCTSCQYRTEKWDCPVWDHPVDGEYFCDVWKERDADGLIDCLGHRHRRPTPFTSKRWATCSQCFNVVNLHVKDE